MHRKTMVLIACFSTLPLADGAYAQTAHPSTPVVVAQAAAGAPMTATQENDERMTICSRYRRAFHQLDKIRAELTQLDTDFSTTDDIRPKLDAMVQQSNDAMMTAKIRVDSCPGRRPRPQ
jgi:hypothetical protein